VYSEKILFYCTKTHVKYSEHLQKKDAKALNSLLALENCCDVLR